MCASHMNHSVGCIKERIKLPVVENKVVSALIWRHVRFLYVVQSRNLLLTM